MGFCLSYSTVKLALVKPTGYARVPPIHFLHQYLYMFVINTHVANVVMRGGANPGKRSDEGAALAPRPPPQRVATICHATNYHEKTTLLSSDDEFQWTSNHKYSTISPTYSHCCYSIMCPALWSFKRLWPNYYRIKCCCFKLMECWNTRIWF